MRITVAAEWTELNITLLYLQLSPTAHACGAHAQTLGSLSMGCIGANSDKHPFMKINKKDF